MHVHILPRNDAVELGHATNHVVYSVVLTEAVNTLAFRNFDRQTIRQVLPGFITPNIFLVSLRSSVHMKYFICYLIQ